MKDRREIYRTSLPAWGWGGRDTCADSLLAPMAIHHYIVEIILNIQYFCIFIAIFKNILLIRIKGLHTKVNCIMYTIIWEPWCFIASLSDCCLTVSDIWRTPSLRQIISPQVDPGLIPGMWLRLRMSFVGPQRENLWMRTGTPRTQNKKLSWKNLM
jgi:hypothetical protein